MVEKMHFYWLDYHSQYTTMSSVLSLVNGHVTVSVRLQFSSVEVTVRTSDLRFAGLASNVLLAHTVFPDKILIWHFQIFQTSGHPVFKAWWDI